MALTIQRLLEPTEEVENFLRNDIPGNGILLYNLTLGWDLCDWYIAHEKNRIRGCLVVYKGGRGLDCFMARGPSYAVSALINQLPHSLVFTISPKQHIPLIEQRYQMLNRGEFVLMNLQQSQYSPPTLTPAEVLTISNLVEVNAFFQSVNAGAWNPVQLKIAPFYCIRKENKIVSICGTIGVYQKEPGVAVIGNLQTLSEYQRQGYGTSVLCHVINNLFESYHYVTLMVEAENEEAIRIYCRLGFIIHDVFVIGVCQELK